MINDKPKTPAYREFIKIKNIQNKNIKEKSAYNALVLLAEESKKKYKKKFYKNRDMDSVENLAAVLVASAILQEIEDKTPKLFLTEEEEILNNYLDQIPITY